ncbi:acyl transferase [Pseudopedobacter beijingensis]|uniref:Acyl transferase n=1 Tax=Pseudopedobacter beijingensis TaxID=1207056 RepID=A0ABW4I6L6_9SPHI
MAIDFNTVFNINSEQEFNKVAIEVYEFQKHNIPVYGDFVNNLKINKIKHYSQIPFLPIQFFKSHQIIKPATNPDIIFSSSGTTGTQTSKHFVQNVDWYIKSYRKAFAHFYGDIADICMIALLPNYLERDGSSLIYMIDDLIQQSKHPDSGFLLYEHDILFEKLNRLKKSGQKTILVGVTYALLDFIEKHQLNFPELIVMETGGMKGKRKEMVREELHQALCNGFGVENIHSEYGMTELLSQAYSFGKGVFKSPNWMKILIRDINDPLTTLTNNKTGGINVIDLANIYSCSFIATQDLGKVLSHNTFEVLGRFDNSDIRGCNLLVG